MILAVWPLKIAPKRHKIHHGHIGIIRGVVTDEYVKFSHLKNPWVLTHEKLRKLSNSYYVTPKMLLKIRKIPHKPIGLIRSIITYGSIKFSQKNLPRVLVLKRIRRLIHTEN